MYGFLRTPRWIALTLVVMILAVVFVNLGLWQLRRHEERRLENQVHAARLEAPPLPLAEAVAAAGDDVASLEFRRVVLVGTYLPDHELLWRGQSNDGQPGYHVVTPFRLRDEGLALVDRGWVPLTVGEPPVHQAPPPEGEVRATGVVRTSQQPGALGPPNPPLPTEVIPRVDVDHLAGQLPGEVLPVWIQLSSSESVPGAIPVPPELPDTDDPGPHLGYALQWFAFTVIGVVGYGFLVRRAARGGSVAAGGGQEG